MQVSIQTCKVLPTIFQNLTTTSFRLELMENSTLARAFQMMTTLIYRELELQLVKVEHSTNTLDFVVRFGHSEFASSTFAGSPVPTPGALGLLILAGIISRHRRSCVIGCLVWLVPPLVVVDYWVGNRSPSLITFHVNL